ncbi:MAG TPA: hypothetical protein PLX06_02590 [Fimbriimonadaceae bacterium]|nr:hypothetical protein [Fimbriimonadaceae bacterium]
MSKQRKPLISDEDAQAIINHYEGQSEDEAAAEDEAAVRQSNTVMIQVPVNRLDEIRAVLASPIKRAAKIAENRREYGKK